MNEISETGLTAFVERCWQFHASQSGGNQVETMKRTAQDLGTHYGLLPDDALSAVWRLRPDN